VVGESAAELVDGLESFLAGERRAGIAAGRREPSAGKLGFVFSGMGAQWAGMGRRLFDDEPVFAESLRRSEAVLRELAGWALIDDLFAPEERTRTHDGDFAQVSNFAIQAALFELWAHWGIRPDAVVGHSAGEIAAAFACGSLGLEQAALLAYHRGRLQARATGQGRMLALAVGREEADAIVAEVEGVELAAVNARSSVTLTGDGSALEELQRRFEERQVFARLVPVAIPYHSAKMDPIRDELLESLAVLQPVDGTIPFASVVTGAWQDGSGLDGEYWWQNVRRPVLFADAVERLVEAGCTTFVELAPHPVLATSVSEILSARGITGAVVPSMRRGEDDTLVARRSLAALYAGGRDV